MKEILILMISALGFAGISLYQKPLNPSEERCVQQYFSELKHYILPDIQNEISGQVKPKDR